MFLGINPSRREGEKRTAPDDNTNIGYLVCAHHFVPRGETFIKEIGGQSFELGIRPVLELSYDDDVLVYCFLQNGSVEDFKRFEIKYPKVVFQISNTNKYDFYNYFLFIRNKISEEYSSVTFFNDNVDLNSNLLAFVRKSSLLLNENIKIVGLGYNTHLTQSIFKKHFSPHVQTYGFTVCRHTFYAFSKKWFDKLDKAYLFPFYKILVCRMLEQGISKYILSAGNTISILKESCFYQYSRSNIYFDFYKDWPLKFGDSRYKSNNPFRF